MIKVRSQAPTFTAIYPLTSPLVWKSGAAHTYQKKVECPLGFELDLGLVISEIKKIYKQLNVKTLCTEGLVQLSKSVAS